SSSYIPYMRIVTRYDSHLNMILDTIEMFVVDEWVMMSGVRMDITYEGNRAVQQIQQASFNGGPWENVMKEVYKNFINLGMEDPLNLSLRLTCYPNPAGDEVILDYSALSSSVWKIEVINLNGKPVRVLNPELPAGRVTLDIQDLPAGFYIIRMIDKMGRTETRQLIKQQ
ncbi:MAG: T9SS type A sorting domain-containing protein, partial [Bacteroidales bacterium]|nr:T9SS type A sorting domain-containing protein [Bacteroidales bacterium]